MRVRGGLESGFRVLGLVLEFICLSKFIRILKAQASLPELPHTDVAYEDLSLDEWEAL